MWLNPQEPADLVTFTREILKGKLHFLCSWNSDRTDITSILISFWLLVTAASFRVNYLSSPIFWCVEFWLFLSFTIYLHYTDSLSLQVLEPLMLQLILAAAVCIPSTFWYCLFWFNQHFLSKCNILSL